MNRDLALRIDSKGSSDVCKYDAQRQLKEFFYEDNPCYIYGFFRFDFGYF